MYPAGEPEKNGAGQPLGQSSGQQNGRAQGALNSGNAAPLARYDSEADEANLYLNDPRTRLLMDQLASVMTQDNRRPSEEKAAPRQFDMSMAWAMLRRRWLLMLGVFLLITTAVAWKLRPGEPSYMATATMLLPKENKSLSNIDITQMRSSDISSSVQTQIAIVTSKPLVERAWLAVPEKLRQRGWPLGKVPMQAVRGAAPVSSDLVDITVTALNPDAAKAMANNLVTVYRLQMRDWADEETVKNIASAKSQVKQTEKQYLNAKRELQEFQQQTGVTSVLDRVAALNTRIQQLTIDSQAAQLDLAAGLASEKVMADSAIPDLEKKVYDAQQNYDAIAERYQPGDIKTQAARQALGDAKNLLEKRRSAFLGQIRQKSADLDVQLAKAKSESASLPPIASKFNELSTKADLLENTYKSLVDRYNALKLSSTTDVSTAKMVVPSTDTVLTGRTWSRVILMAVLCGLILSLMAGVLAEQIDNTVHSTNELETLIGSPVLGSLPMFTDDAERRLAFAIPSKQTGSSTELARAQTEKEAANFSAARPLLEACRILRSNVNFSMMDAPLRSILVTSADPGEGKSMCALNLATVMAYDGKRVILLDCDLRRPTQHRLCSSPTNKVPMRPGFVDVLAGLVSIEDALRPTPVENLRVMPAGTLPPNPPELLSSHAGQNLLAELRSECDLLVIDSPPLMFLTDSQVLASFVDGAVLVVAASQTARGHVQRAHSVLRNAGGRVLGVIFNKVKAHNDPDAYYGSYYSYYAPTTEDGGDWAPQRDKRKRRRSQSAESQNEDAAEEREEANVD